MSVQEHISLFLTQVRDSLTQGTFVKMTLGNYKGAEEDIKQVGLKRVIIKKEDKLSFTYRYKTRDIVKNYSLQEGLAHVEQALSNGFNYACLYSVEHDLILEKDLKGKSNLKQMTATNSTVLPATHDRTKNRLITTTKPYLHELNITDKTGKVYDKAQDKYRQINHFVQIVDSLIRNMDQNLLHKVVDMGSGKWYLSFALYDYLTNVLKINVQLTGIEYRKELTDLCNTIAKHSGFEGLDFKEGTIDNYDSTGTNILIALHACDTATDDAIWKGINGGAALIMVSPCCHKQIRREIEKNKAGNELDFLTKYGIFLERQAEMVTDGIRALILEYHGYTTKVFDFIADAHTPKNVMIAAVKDNKRIMKDTEILDEINRVKAYFGISYHHLERLAGL